MTKYKEILEYLRLLSETYGLDICISDFVGFLYTDYQLYSQLQPYLIHKNPYCMYIKSNKDLWKKCISMKKKLLEKSLKTKGSYYGICYCGVGEYTIPVYSDECVIGVISVGSFSSHPEVSSVRRRKIAKEFSLDNEILSQKFDISVKANIMNAEWITSLIGILAAYLSEIYSIYSVTGKIPPPSEGRRITSESYILSHALEYIRQNYNKEATVKKLADFCHCSESYLSHVFKSKMKINIRSYINKLKVEHAKLLLLNTSFDVSAVAAYTGFNDPNYFSCVFKEFCGVPPSQYRKQVFKM